ncbi:IS3 family transposase, partial [Ancylobacter oerskovii]|nr:IS3 family transposase [Ancylobacter oerskovii]
QGALTATAAEEEVVPASAFRGAAGADPRTARLLGKKTLEVEILQEALTVAEDIKKRRLRSLSLPKDGLP